MASHDALGSRLDLRGRRVLVVGLGASGRAAARVALALGARVLAADQRDAPELASGLVGSELELHLGGHPPELADRVDLVIVSPGVPLATPVLARAQARGIPIWGEVELGARLLRGRLIGITGSNGKSTTTAMAGAILRAAGLPGGTGGNLGPPLTELVQADAPHAVHAVELSSFQLETIVSLRAHVAVILNLEPDHLDRHGSFDAYVAAKARLLDTQGPHDFAVLNADDPCTRALAGRVRGHLAYFSLRERVVPGAYLDGEQLVVALEGPPEILLRRHELPLPGEHNVANALAAALACRLVGCPPEAIARAQRAFRALPHRLQFVAEVDGVAFFDDSKATNPAAAARALASFPAGRVHLILGGRDKGADWSPLIALLPRHVRAVWLVGEAAAALARLIGDRVPAIVCGSVRRAVRAAFEAAACGDVVLLAPGCASFDQYANYEERGRDFQRAVQDILPAEGGGRA